MIFINLISIKRYILYTASCALITGTFFIDSHAMSQKLDNENTGSPYRPTKWSEKSDPDADAKVALENHDYRLLAFALRITSVPGIKPDEIKMIEEKCGLRYMRNFGDVIHSDSDLKRMSKARDYAVRYNERVSIECKVR